MDNYLLSRLFNKAGLVIPSVSQFSQITFTQRSDASGKCLGVYYPDGQTRAVRIKG